MTTIDQVNFEIGIIEGKLDAMGLDPRESDLLALLAESESATELRNQITALERTASYIRWTAKVEAQNAWLRAHGVNS
jgi:hypothetical protein